MTDIALLAIDVTSAPAVKGAADLDKLTVAAGKAEAATEKLATSTKGVVVPLNSVSRGSVLAGNNVRMLSQQLSQVGQQTLATGNFLQALAIQLPDIGLAFGAVGTAAGLLAAIALPAVASALFGTSDAAQKAKATLDGLDDAVKAYTEAAAAAAAPTDELIAKYGQLSTVAQQALQALSDVRQVEAIGAVDAAVAQLTQTLLGAEGTRAGALLADDFGLAADAASRLQAALNDLRSANGLEAQARAAGAVRDALFSAYGSVEAMPKPLQDAVAQLGIIIPRAAEVDAKTKSTKASQDALNASLAGAYGLYANLVGQASALADETNRAAMAAASLNYGKIQNSGQSGPDAAKSSVQGLNANAPGVLSSGAGGVRRSTGGGGSAGTDDFASRLESLQTELKTERQVVDDWYAEAQTILADRRAQEILGTQEHKNALLEVERLYQEQIAQIEGDAANKRLTDTASLFGSLQSVAESGGKGLAKAAALFGAIQGTINSYVAATEALRTPGLSLAGRFAAYASVLATGLKGVAAIKSAGGGGGSSGGSGRAAAQGSAATTAVQAEKQSVLRVQGLRATDILTGQMVFDLFMGEGRLRGSPIVELIR